MVLRARLTHRGRPHGPLESVSLSCAVVILLSVLDLHLQFITASKCGISSGAFINLCGQCIETSSGLSETDGQNSCGVCYGYDHCRDCNGDPTRGDCGKCFDPDCIALAAVFPQKIDVATLQKKAKTNFVLQGHGLSEQKLGEVVCSFYSGTNETNNEIPAETSQDVVGIHVSVNSSLLETGSYQLHCHSATVGAIKSNVQILVVDSSSLVVEGVTPHSVTADDYFQAILSVRNIVGGKNSIICFVRVNDEVEIVVRAKLTSGRVECDPMVVTYASEMAIGVAETVEAAMDKAANLKTVKLLVHSNGPTMKSATFSPDLRQLWIKFDQNVNSSQECKYAFTPETASLFGKEWLCWLRADQLTVQLGTNPSVHPGSRLTLRQFNGIVRAHADEGAKMALESAVIVEDVTNQIVEPRYRVLDPRMTCHVSQASGVVPAGMKGKVLRDSMGSSYSNSRSMTVVQVQELGGQSLSYNWSVGFVPQPKGSSQHFHSQREMLLLWLSVRSLDKTVRKVTTNEVSINNSLMLTGVVYELTVRGMNSLGMTGEEKRLPLKLPEKPPEMEHRARYIKNVTAGCASGAPPEITLLSSPATFADVDCWVELTVSCCDGDIMTDFLNKVEYMWSVDGNGGTKLDASSIHGKQLMLPAGSLHGGESYNITCLLMDKESITAIGSASVILETLERGIQTVVNVSAVAVSTDQPLILDASGSIDLDNKPGSLQFEWTCRASQDMPGIMHYGDSQCIIPGPKKQLLNDVFRSEFNQPLLRIPPGHLAIGRYQFSVRAYKGSVGKSVSLIAVDVRVVGGSPPLVFFPSPSSHAVSPEEGISVSGSMIGLKPGCLVFWSSSNVPGYIALNQSSLGQELHVAATTGRNHYDFVLDLHPPLVGDAKYRIRLSAVCDHLQAPILYNSYAEVDIVTDAPPIPQPLKVEPVEGEGLITTFKFSTRPAYDDLTDYPLSYSFGYYILEGNTSQPAQKKFFHTSRQQLSAVTFLPATSVDEPTKLYSVLRVCDARHVCHMEEGPIITMHAPKQLVAEQVNSINEYFSSLLSAEEYEDAVMLVETSMHTLAILEDKTLYKLASQGVEASIKNQLDVVEKKVVSSPETLHAALRFLDAASAALKHGTFSQETLQRLVDLKDKILHMLSSPSEIGPSVEHRSKRRTASSYSGVELNQTVKALTPEMVRTLIGISEVAILNLNDTNRSLTEKQKLLQNVSFYIESLCRNLRSSLPLFIGSKVVSFSVQKLNLQIKYKDELAVPDWRSAKTGGAPVNATALIQFGSDVAQKVGTSNVCMGGAIYPIDFLSEITSVNLQGFFRLSAVYHIKVLPMKSIPQKFQQQKYSFVDSLNGLDIGPQSVQIKIPLWSVATESPHYLKCFVWHSGTWTAHSCTLMKRATLLNKPAVECQCSILGYYAIFATKMVIPNTSTQETVAVSSPTASTEPSLLPLTERVATQSIQPLSQSTQTHRPPTQPTTEASIKSSTQGPVISPGETATEHHISSTLPPGIPIANTTQNFTFRIQEDFASTVGTRHVAFISRLKRDILRQVDMPENMIASIDLSPGSILVTLHLVDTDVRTVNDVVPALAAALQSGQLSVSGVDGQELSVPPQSLQLLQRTTDTSEHTILPWIATGCIVFSVFCVTSLIAAAVIVKRKQHEQLFNDVVSPDVEVKAPQYGRFHLEQTLDGSETMLSRYRCSTSNPLVVSTVGGLASVMGTNITPTNLYFANSARYKLQSPLLDTKDVVIQNRTQEPAPHHNCSNCTSVNASGSSGSNSTSSSVQRRFGMHKGSTQRHSPLVEDGIPIIVNDEANTTAVEETDEEDSGIVVIMDGKKNISGFSVGSSHTLEANVNQRGAPPDVILLPGTPSGKDKTS